MTDYLAEARGHADAADEATFGSPAYLAHLTAVTALAGMAVAEAMLPIKPREPSRVALDRTEEQEDIRGALLRWRAADRLFDPDCREWQDETHRLRDLADRIGLAR